MKYILTNKDGGIIGLFSKVEKVDNGYMCNDNEMYQTVVTGEVVVSEVSDDYAFENEGICEATVSKRIDQAVARYEMAQSNITALSSKLLVGVWKLDGLNELIQTSEDSDADLKARFKSKTLGVSHLNDVVIDGLDSSEYC